MAEAPTTITPEPNAPDSPAPPPAPRPRPSAWRALARVLALLILSCLCAGAAVTVAGTESFHWRAFDIDLNARPAWQGQTRLVLTPLGDVRANTHRAPVALTVSLRAVSFDDARKLVMNPPPREELEREFGDAARRALRQFAMRQVLVGALGALLAPLLLRPRKARWWVLAPVVGGALVASVLGMGARTFDRKAFESPTYTGSLRQAGWAIELAKEAFSKADTLGVRLRRVAANLDVLYGRINAVPGLAADVDTIKVLHISDIHNNPAAVQFVEELSRRVRVDLVIDTGDLTDFGTPVESVLTKAMGKLPAPYLFVPGNHDSQATVRAVRSLPNAVVLEGRPVRAAGLSVLGAPDPSSFRPEAGSVDTTPQALDAAGARLADAYKAMPVPPDIVAVHDPRQAAALLGTARLVLAGHEHRAYIETVRGTVLCNAGTTGAAGARYLDRRAGVPFSAEMLYFSRAPQPRLLFVDQVVLDGSLGQYSITRRPFGVAPPR